MRNYRVVENDVDVHAIWRAAKTLGFRDLQLAVFHAPPFRVPLDEFEDFLAGGQATAPWVTSTRVFLRNARTFFLTKAGDEHVDSRRAEGLDVPHPSCRRPRRPCRPARPIEIDALVTNTGTSTWLPWTAGHGGVGCGAHLYDGFGALLEFDAAVSPIGDPPREIAPWRDRRGADHPSGAARGPLRRRAGLRRRARLVVRAARLATGARDDHRHDHIGHVGRGIAFLRSLVPLC